MTSAEFAVKYKLLRPVAGKGARSHLAQQTDLGRVVLVHFLDAGTADENRRLLERALALPSAAREKILETVDVDGVRVIVMRFSPGLEDLQAWVTESEGPQAARRATGGAGVDSEFMRLFGAADAPQTGGSATAPMAAVPRPPAPTVAPPKAPAPQASAPPPAAREPGEFTQLFQGLGASASPRTPVASQPSVAAPPLAAPPPAPALSSAPPPPPPPPAVTLPFAAVARPAPSPPPPQAPARTPPAPPAPPAPAAAPDGSGFTGIFGKSGAAPLKPVDGPLPIPVRPVSPLPSPSIIPPVSHVDPPRPAATPVAASKPPSSGEFTQLFERLGTPATSSPSVPASPRPAAPPPASAPPPVPAPLPASPPQPRAAVVPPLQPPQPRMPPAPTLPQPGGSHISFTPAVGQPIIPLNTPAAGPPHVAGPNWASTPLAAPTPQQAGESEFTRILGRVTPPGQAGAPSPAPIFTPPPPPPPPAPAPPVALAPTSEKGSERRVNLPVIIAINVLLIATIAVILYFVLRH